MGASRLQFTLDRFQYCGGFLENLGIPESNDAVSVCFNATLTTFVVCTRFLMLSSIKLDHQFRIKARKVRNITANRNLPPKSITIKLPATQVLPEKTLGISGVISKDSAAALCNRVTHAVIIRLFAPTLTLPRTACRGGKQSSNRTAPLGGFQGESEF